MAAPAAGSTPAPAATKVSLDDFEIGEQLGEGSYGIVNLATMKTTGAKYAIKVLDKRQLIKENKVQAVSRERAILNGLNHPFVVKLYYAMQDPANLYFVMEFCPGGELFAHIKKLGAFNLECTVFYTAETVVALEYIHNKGIIHRDLKPENILLATNGHIKLIDFGTAKDIGVGEAANKARSDSFCGTAEYVSPELLNEKPASPGSDLWALGCIIYQLACGRPPFKGKTQYQTFQLVGKGQFTYPPHFPVKAKELINQLLVLDTEKRLGYGTTTYNDLKAHPFFANINWENLATTTPPVLKPPAIKPTFPNEEEVKRQNTIMVKSKSMIPFNIEDLPDAFLFKICSYLSFADLIRVSQVCKRLHNITLDSRLWDNLLGQYQRFLEADAAKKLDDSVSMESELEDLKIDPDTNEVVSASVNKLVDYLASETSTDYSFQRTFLLTYQTFMPPQRLLLAFFRRYNNIYPVLGRLLRLVSVLKTWLDLYFERDFDSNMIMALKVFIRGKLMYDAKPTVAQNLANSLQKKLKPREIKTEPSQKPPPPKIVKLPVDPQWNDLPEEELARQLTLGDFSLFANIKSEELFNQNYSKAPELAPNVCKMVQRFNQLCRWVPTVIVKAERIKERVKVLARMIRVARHLRDLNNFYGLMAFMAGINCGAVSRLKYTFEMLPKDEKKILAALEAEMGQENIHTKYRETLSKISPPCIPYLGMLLKDLILVEQGNEDMVNGLINFRKRRLMYNVISLLDQYRTCRYVLIELPSVLNMIQRMLEKGLDDNETFQISQRIEPRGAKKNEIN